MKPSLRWRKITHRKQWTEWREDDKSKYLQLFCWRLGLSASKNTPQRCCWLRGSQQTANTQRREYYTSACVCLRPRDHTVIEVKFSDRAGSEGVWSAESDGRERSCWRRRDRCEIYPSARHEGAETNPPPFFSGCTDLIVKRQEWTWAYKLVPIIDSFRKLAVGVNVSEHGIATICQPCRELTTRPGCDPSFTQYLV